MGEHQAFLEHGTLLEQLREATAVVCHGGPGTLVESLRSGRVPIAVPREQRYGEVVDDHQFAFCAFLAERGEIVLGDTEDKLHRALHRMLTEPGASAAPPLSYDADHGATVERFADMVGDCVPARRGWLLTEWRRHRAVPGTGQRDVRTTCRDAAASGLRAGRADPSAVVAERVGPRRDRAAQGAAADARTCRDRSSGASSERCTIRH